MVVALALVAYPLSLSVTRAPTSDAAPVGTWEFGLSLANGGDSVVVVLSVASASPLDDPVVTHSSQYGSITYDAEADVYEHNTMAQIASSVQVYAPGSLLLPSDTADFFVTAHPWGGEAKFSVAVALLPTDAALYAPERGAGEGGGFVRRYVRSGVERCNAAGFIVGSEPAATLSLSASVPLPAAEGPSQEVVSRAGLQPTAALRSDTPRGWFLFNDDTTAFVGEEAALFPGVPAALVRDVVTGGSAEVHFDVDTAATALDDGLELRAGDGMYTRGVLGTLPRRLLLPFLLAAKREGLTLNREYYFFSSYYYDITR